MPSIQTYAVIENDHSSDRKEAYSYFVFPSLKSMRGCVELNEHSIVFSTVQQLREAYTQEELIGVMEATYASGKHIDPLDAEATGYLRKVDTHEQFYRFCEFVSRKYKPIIKEDPVEVKATAPVIHVDQFNNKAQKAQTTERAVRSKYDAKAEIVVTGSNPYREGSNRWHNFEALRKSNTVGEALIAMKALTPGGNSVDIKLALAKGAIQLKG